MREYKGFKIPSINDYINRRDGHLTHLFMYVIDPDGVKVNTGISLNDYIYEFISPELDNELLEKCCKFIDKEIYEGRYKI